MKKFLKFRPVFYFVLLIVFALLPLQLIEEHSFCPLYLITGLKCMGCGVTRSFCAFMHFDFKTAFEYNPVFASAVFPTSVFLMLEDSILLFLRHKNKTTRRSVLEQGADAVFNLFKGRN